MNIVIVRGNLTKEPRVTKDSKGGISSASFCIASNRGKDRDGNDLGADFPTFIAFNNIAGVVARNLHKGSPVLVTAHIKTGSYTDASGKRIFTEDHVVDKIEFIGKKEATPEPAAIDAPIDFEDIPEGLEAELPFV